MKDLLNICRDKKMTEQSVAAKLFSLPAGRTAAFRVRRGETEPPRLVHRCLLRVLLNTALQNDLLEAYNMDPIQYYLEPKGSEWLSKNKRLRNAVKGYLMKERSSG